MKTLTKNYCSRSSAGFGACLVLAVCALPLSFARAGTCLISGSTNRVSAASVDRPLTGVLDSFSRDLGAVVFEGRFRSRLQGLLILVK